MINYKNLGLIIVGILVFCAIILIILYLTNSPPFSKKSDDSQTSKNSDDSSTSNNNLEDCVVSEWSDWSKCNTSCGDGMKMRTRKIIKPAGKGGKACPLEYQLNEMTNCPDNPLCDNDGNPIINKITNNQQNNCVVSDWSEWSQCNPNCGSGIKMRQRTIIKQAGEGGKTCPVDYQLTNIINCIENLECPKVNCSLGEWSQWTNCSNVCGIGKQERFRQIIEPSKFGDNCIEETRQEKVCNTECILNISLEKYLDVGSIMMINMEGLFDLPSNKSLDYYKDSNLLLELAPGWKLILSTNSNFIEDNNSMKYENPKTEKIMKKIIIPNAKYLSGKLIKIV